MQKMKNILWNVQEPAEYALCGQRSFSLRAKYNIAKGEEQTSNVEEKNKLSGVIISQTTGISDISSLFHKPELMKSRISMWVPS